MVFVRIALILVFIILTAVLSQKLKIIEQPSDSYGLLDQQITLRCKSSDDSDKISWYKDGKPINFNGNLFVFLLNYQTEGQYQCNVSNSDEFSMSDQATVRIAYLNNFTALDNSRKLVSPGSTFLLECSVPDGLPRPEVEWKSNTTFLNHRFKSDSNHNMRIDNVQRSDAGFYWCEAKNLASTKVSPPINLVIFQRPIFLTLPKHLKVMVSKDVLFPCIVTGDNPMFVQWYKLGSSKSDISLSRSSLAGNCSLIIRNIRLEDKGAYVCQARNHGGISEIIFQLSVISFPSFTETPDNVEARLGDSIMLKCAATGMPQPRVFWIHRNKYILSDSENVNERVIVFENGTLLISSLRSTDHGKYVCLAASYVGISKSEAVITTVVPDNLFPPIIELVPQNTTAIEGSTIILTCRSGQATISWYKQSLKIIGMNLINARQKLLKNGDLVISNLKIQDSSTYTCRATSKGLFSDKTAYLKVKPFSDVGESQSQSSAKKYEFPTAPVNLTVDFVGDTYIRLNWQTVTDDKLYRFSVEVAEQFVNNWRTIGVTEKKTMIVNSLRKNNVYKVLVRSLKDSMIGNVAVYNDIIYTLDKPTIPLDSNYNDYHPSLQNVEIDSVTLNSISSRQVEVSWNVKGGSVLRLISGFYVKAQPVNIERCKQMTEKLGQQMFSCLENQDYQSIYDALNRIGDKVALPSSKKTFTVVKSFSDDRTKSTTVIGDLDPFICYEVEIEAFIDHVDAGTLTGRDSTSISILTYDDVPRSSPTIKSHKWIDNSTLLLSWNKLDPQFSNGPIIGYVVQLVNIRTKYVQNFEVNFSTLEYKVRVDSIEDTYVLYVSAKSCRGHGPRSWPLRIKMGSVSTFARQDFAFDKPWVIASIASGVFCGVLLTAMIVFLFICKKHKNQSTKSAHLQLSSINKKEMEDSVSKFHHYDPKQKLLSNYETISPTFNTTCSDLISTECDPGSGTTTVPRFSGNNDDPLSISRSDPNINDSLAYASSSIIYKGCQHYNPNLINKFPVNFYGPYIDIISETKNPHQYIGDPQFINNPMIPPPPMYPPPPAPRNQNNFSDTSFVQSVQGSHNNTQSSGSASACGSGSNKSNKTRKSRTPQSLNQSLNSSSSSKSQKNQLRKSAKSGHHSSGELKKKDSISTSTHGSQPTGLTGHKVSLPQNTCEMALVSDNPSDIEPASDASETDEMGNYTDEQARDTDSVRVMYKLPLKRPPSPDYSTDSSYPYSMANHYSSMEPTFPVIPNNLPTKF